MDIFTALLIFGAGFAAAFIGGLAGGGGGLLSIPALIFLGLPVNTAVATNRVGALGFATSSTLRFATAKKIVLKHVIPVSICMIIGMIIGTKILIDINEALLYKIVGIFLLLSIPLLILKKTGLKQKKVSKGRLILGYLLYFLQAIYTGLFGGGAGIIAMYIFIHLFGLTFIQSSAVDKVAYFFAIIISLIMLGFAGLINYTYGFILVPAMLLGGWCGAHTAIKKGNYFVRIIFALVVVVSSVKLLFF